MSDKTGGLDGALLLAQRAIGGVEKRGKNAFHKYNYATAEDMLRAAREALIEAGVLVGVSRETTVLDGHVALVSTFRLSHPATGETRTETSVTPAIPEKGRPLDKALQAAATSSLSYYLRDLLLIPRVAEGEDIQGRDDTAYQAPPRPTPVPRGPVAPVVESILAEARTSRPAAPTGPLDSISQDEARSLVGAWTRSQGADAVRELRDAHGLPEQSSSWTIQQWRSFAAACEAEFAGSADG